MIEIPLTSRQLYRLRRYNRMVKATRRHWPNLAAVVAQVWCSHPRGRGAIMVVDFLDPERARRVAAALATRSPYGFGIPRHLERQP